MSKVLIVSATPRKNGNSQLLADEFARGAREAGHTVEAFALRDLELKFCIGCLACQRTGKCVLSDSVNALLPKVQEADVLVFATPVYYYGLSGQLKTFLDRLNPLFGRQNAFKRVYLLVAARRVLSTVLSRACRAGSTASPVSRLRVSSAVQA